MQKTPHFSAGSDLILSRWDCQPLAGSPFRYFWSACTTFGLAALMYNSAAEAVLDVFPERLKGSVSRQGLPPWPVFEQLEAYFAGVRTRFEIPLDISWMTPFQQRVLRAISSIPCGHTATYAGIAQSLGKPKASRAVGAANACNPVAIIIPCHRMVGSDGSLRGYGGQGGLRTKAWLLAHEQQISGGHLRYTG